MNVLNFKVLRRIFLYALIGGFSASLDTVVYILLEGYAELPNLVANFFSVNFGMLVSFILNTFINFKVKDKIKRRAFKFFCIGYSGLILSSLIMWIGIDILVLTQLYVKLFSVVVVAGFQFILNSVVTYKA